jgi:hypothetical protein
MNRLSPPPYGGGYPGGKLVAADVSRRNAGRQDAPIGPRQHQNVLPPCRFGARTLWAAAPGISRPEGTGASVAQLVEQRTLNPLVPGSSPGRGTKLFSSLSGRGTTRFCVVHRLVYSRHPVRSQARSKVHGLPNRADPARAAFAKAEIGLANRRKACHCKDGLWMS